ncbi:hypothetical protein V8E36_003079 [Tilletia maclaganii]
MSAVAVSSGPERLVVPALCQPSLLADLPTTDPISNLLAKHIPPHLRHIRDASGTFPPNESPKDPDLAAAMRMNAWRRIATFARDRIISAGAPVPLPPPPTAPLPDTTEQRSIEPAGANDVSTVLRWWNVRLQALLRLRLCSQFRLELESLWAILKRTTIPRHVAAAAPSGPSAQQQPDQDGQTAAPAYVRPTVRYARLLDSPVVPFTLHVLRAREPIFAGDPRAALEKCHALLQRCQVMQRRFLRVAQTDGVQSGNGEIERGARAEAALWKDRARRLTIIIAFLLLDLEDYPTAISLLRPWVSSRPKTSAEQTYNLLLARLFLEGGAVGSARACIDSVAASLRSSPDTQSQGHAQRQLLRTSQALLAIWQNNYGEAEAIWKDSLPIEGGPAEAPADPATLSNLALTQFYQGRVEEGTSLLERVLQEEPSTATSAEAVIFNLITMHELRSDDSLSQKRRILVHVAKWAGDGGSTSCLKLA